MEEFDDRFATVLAAYLDPAHAGPPDPDTPLRDLGVDSLGMVGLISDLECEFDLEFPDADINIQTFRSARTLLGVVRRIAPGR